MIDQETVNSLFDMTYGLYVVSAADGGKLNGQLTNTVFQVTAEPPRMAVAIHKNNHTHSLIAASRAYSVCTLAEGTPMTVIGLWGFRSGRDLNKFAKVRHEAGVTGSPLVLDNTISCFEVNVKQTVDVGTHTLFIGDIVKGKLLAQGKPLTYDYYYHVMKGKTPRNATTFKPPEQTAGKTEQK